MLYAVSQELDAALRAKGVPFRVVYGPEPAASVTAAGERIVIEQLIDEKRDSIVPTRATHLNPTMPLIRQQAGRVRIYARSSVGGAAWHDHAERAEQVLDHVLGELDAIVRGRGNTMIMGPAGFVALVDAKGSSVWSGATYELDFAIDRGIFRRTWAGEAREEVVVGTDVDIVNTTKVSQATGAAGTPPGDAETATGGG